MTTSAHDHATTDLTVQLPVKMVDTLRDLLTTKEVDINTLVAGYISNGIEHDLPGIHRKCFFKHVKEVLEKHNVPPEAIAEIDDKFSY